MNANTKQVLLRLDLHRQAKMRAASNGQTLLEYLSELVERDLAAPKTEQPKQAA